MHENKQKPTVSNGVRASSFEIWTANLAQSLTMGILTNPRSFIFGVSNWKFCSRSPRRYPKTWHSDADISDLGFKKIMLLFLREKNQNLLDIQEQTANGKNTKWAKTFVWCLLLIFKVVYQDHFTQLLPFAWDFIAKGQQWLVWGQQC